jgi:sugar phosphate isomerase/epimerase
MEKISAIGYRAAQLSYIRAMDGESPHVSVQEAKRIIDDNGIRCIATHRKWDDLVHNQAKEIDFHRTLDCDFTAIGGIPAEYKEDGEDGYRRWVDDTAPVIAGLKEAGIRFGIHNHSYEFAWSDKRRRPLYDVYIEQGAPSLMLEIDVYWMVHAGINPLKIIEANPGRCPVVHIKDKEPVGWEVVQAPIGEGCIEWDVILPALEKAGTEWYCIEQDDYRRDPFDCLRSSFEFLAP